jgi:hypothetical protein
MTKTYFDQLMENKEFKDMFDKEYQELELDLFKGSITILPPDYPLWALDPDFLEYGKEETIEDNS